MKVLLRLITELSSRKWISKIVGTFAKSKWSKPFIPRFIQTYGIKPEEAEKSIHEYGSLNDFFIRKLRADLRPIQREADTLVSPVDALITAYGTIQDGLMMDIKGQNYTIHELLNDSPRTVNYIQGTYFVLYLSPTDYHRIHAPIEGTIVEKEHIPGKVYPVNDFGLLHMKKVLSRNERLITYIQHQYGETAVVKVGALNVSSIQYSDALTPELERGQELAYFEFGSTVVLLLENDTFEALPEVQIGNKVLMGEALGKIKEKKRAHHEL